MIYDKFFQPHLEVTEAESEYRTKHYHDLRVLKQRDSSCASCGNILSHESGEIFLHPVFHVLQCRKCNDRVKSTPGSDSVVSCHICTIQRDNLYECGEKNCPYKFCHACIKRNAPRVLSDAESKKWKCFVCNPRPLWKLRGACAAIMSSTSKRTKRKKVSRNKSSDTDDEKSSVKNVSYVRKRRLAEAVKMSKRLSTFCDEASPGQISNTWRPTLDENTRRTKKNLNITDSFEQYPGSEKTLTVVTTSEDSDADVLMPNGCRDTSKSRKKNSPTRAKGVKILKKISRSQDSHDRKTWTNTRKLRSKVSSSHRNVSMSSSDSDDDDIEMLKRPAPPSYGRQKSESQVKPSESKRKTLHDGESNDEEKVSINKNRKVAVATLARKSDKSFKDDKAAVKNYNPADEEDTEINNYSKKTSKQNGRSKISIMNDEGRLKKPTRDKVKSKNLESGAGDDSSEKNRDPNERIDERSGKSFHFGRVKGQTAASDSSSSREFCKSKLFRNSYVSLKRISELDEDYTKTPEDSPESPEDIISKDQTFALKNSVTYFFAELRKAAAKLVNDIEHAQAKYCMKDSMRPTDADRLILETKNVVTTLKKCVDRGENKMDDYYEKWCKKTRVRNILNTRKTSDEKKSPKKLSIENSSLGRKIGTESLAQSININGATECIMVSDCNSEEIFSNGEAENITRKRCSTSPCTISRRISASPDKDETSRVNNNISSEDTNEEDTARPNTGDKLGEKSILPCNRVSDRDSVDPSDVDIFESTLESPGDDTNKGKTVRKDDNSEIESSEREISKTTDKESPGICNIGAEKTDKGHSEIEASDDEKFSTKSCIETNDKNNEISPGVEPNVTDLPINESGKTAPDKITIDETAKKKFKSHNDDNSNNSIILDSTNDRSLKLSLKDQNVDKDTASSTKFPSNVGTSGDKRDRGEIGIHCDDAKAAKNNEENSESIYSLETVDGGNDDLIIENGSKSPSVIDGNQTQSSLDTVFNVADNNDVVERGGSESSDHEDSEKLVSTETVVGENIFEKDGSKSPGHDNWERRSSLDTVIVENIAEDVEKTGPNSPIVGEKRYSSNGKKNDDDRRDEKCVSESKEVDNMGSCPSVNVVLAVDDVDMPMDESSKSRSNVSRYSTSSTPSETDELRVREMLLMSSNSDDSSLEDSLALQNSGRIQSENPSPTSSKSNESSESTRKDTSKIESENKQQHTRMKRNKFRLEDNPHLMADEQLNRRCEISLMRLEKEILDRYSRVLEESREYVESKKLKRLVALDKLDKKKKSIMSSDSENEDASSSKDLRNKRKSRATKERGETLLDHLEKVKNGKNIVPSDQSDSEQSDQEKESVNKSGGQNDDSLFAEADRVAKKRLLESSDSAEADGPSPCEPQEKGSEEPREKTKKAKTVAKKEKLAENEDEKREKSEKGRWRKNKILTLRISDTDSEEEKNTFESSQEKLSERKKNEESQSDSVEERTPKKKRVRRRVLHSDSDVEISSPSKSESSDGSIKRKKKNKDSSDDDAKKKARKRIRREESGASSSDSLEQKRPKTRRKRIKKAASDSDSDVDTTQGTPGKSGRKNIRKVIRDKQVADDTKQAAKDEEERLQRIAERQKLYNQMYENRLAGEEKVDKLVLDFDETTKIPLVSVDEALVKRLKPHQAQGIKFMWDACFESLERTKTTKGSGCILAHCMGLGKTFQIVALSHTLLQHEETGIKTIMVVCPLSTVLNWVNEFKIWLENLPDGDDIEVYELTRMKKNFERKYQLQRWQKTGGVMIIGYEMFRNLSNTGKKVRKNIQEVFSKSLVDPGPDLIVCDEGHLLKNEETALSKAMRRVRTLRRIVLTGTPLQNNLIEYHCMVQFVKPNLLGTKKEFTNRFESPITNGQFDDSTEYDVRLMKKRAHVLHKMLEGSVQRLDYSVLTPFLPPKQEYVIFVKLTEIQIKMYRHYLDNYARRHRGVGGSLFADFQALQRIWTHPLVMQMNAKKIELANEKKRLDATDSEGSLCDFIDDDSDSDSSDTSDVRSASGSDDDSRQKLKRGTRANPLQDEPLAQGITSDKTEDANNVDHEWWTQFVKEEDYEDIRISSKLLMLFAILKESHSIGDKVLVFSQSLYSLSLIEEFLRMIDDATQNGNDEPENLGNHTGSWSLGLDYFRLDGQTTTDNRRRWCDIFNRPTNTRARLFLISTRAGGLGINLTAANRVIIFDASWNPSHDVQSIFRIYRFGQKKPCYVYRLLAAGTMEEKIYNRQVTKLSLSCRVVDEQQIERHYSNNALAELYKLEISETEHTHNLPKDRLLADILLQYKHCVDNYHEHDSLLENQAGEELDEEERQQAWLEYEEEKKGKRLLPPNPFMTYQNELLMQQMNLINMAQSNPAITNPAMMLDYENIKQMMSKDYPGVSEAQQQAMATRTVYEMYNYVERQALAHQSPMGMMNLGSGAAIPPFENRIAPQISSSHPTPEMIRLYQQSLVQQQNGQMSYPINHGVMADSIGHARNHPIGSQISQLSSQTAPSAMSSVVDDDIVEIPPSPEKNLVPSTSVPGGSRKSQEE